MADAPTDVPSMALDTKEEEEDASVTDAVFDGSNNDDNDDDIVVTVMSDMALAAGITKTEVASYRVSRPRANTTTKKRLS